MPGELEAANMVDKFGASAVFGRTLGVGEMRSMNRAQAVYRVYQSRDRYRDEAGVNNWAEWAQKFPDDNELLDQAMTEAEE